ncbi:hypothetical protein [Paenibacillus sedimenti]|uniref:Uncharacterized protein n=1 Tax=Paenibacillus sedimenti TaxID=2770274 RepID=A0A926KV44_9BACL|nr:hypothetical protein [Paenibacillus sedimenti]MBD0384752.1 hypothetical protein [Paenibacillus sedimenti]
MIRVLTFVRFLVGVLCIILGIIGYMWWNTLLKESGGPDQGSGIIMVLPNFIAMLLVVSGLVFLVQGMIRLLKS